MRRSITSSPGGTHAPNCVSMSFSFQTSRLLLQLVHNRNSNPRNSNSSSSNSNLRNRIPLRKMQSRLRQIKASPA